MDIRTTYAAAPCTGAALPTPEQANSPDPRRARRRPDYVPEDPLLAASEAAAERRQALSSFWRDVKAGRVPAAIYVSPRCSRWRRSEIRAALEACRAR